MTLLLALLASVQLAAPGQYPQDVDCQDYGDGSPMAMSECLASQSETWEHRLDAEYRGALARAEVDTAKLRQAQRAWRRYRDANCEAYDTVKGSIHTILTGRCWLDMTRARTLELQEMVWIG